MGLAFSSTVVICNQTSQQLRRALTRRARRQSRAGFTIIELLTVLVFIGIIAAASAPSFVRLMKDRRVNSIAVQMASFYRTARARSMGRGSAIMVRYNDKEALPSALKQAGHVTMREAITGPSGQAAELPSTSCFGTDWTNAGVTSKFVMTFDERRKRYAPGETKFLNDSGTVTPYAEMCFTPRGRSFIRYSSGGTWQALTGVPRIEVTNTETNRVRYVVLPPNGGARLATEI